MKPQNFVEITEYFPSEIKSVFLKIPDAAADGITEIRLRRGQPFSVVANGQTRFVTADGNLSAGVRPDCPRLSEDGTAALFSSLCGNSVYSHGDELAAGYISFGRGFRAGVCGRAVYSGGKITALRDIFSFNIRVARQIKGIGEKYFHLAADGLLIMGAPSSGKTTLLRDIIRLLSIFGTRVAVIDSRNELSGSVCGNPGYDLGPSADILSGWGKADGIETAVRTLSPQIIAFDEFSTAEEYREISGGVSSGVAFICTVHGAAAEDLILKPELLELIKNGVFNNILLLTDIFTPPERLAAADVLKKAASENPHTDSSLRDGESAKSGWRLC